MQLFKNLIGCLRKDNKKEKPFSKIISYEFVKSKTDTDSYYFRPFIRGYFKICSSFTNDRKEYYTIVSEISGLFSVKVRVFVSNDKLINDVFINGSLIVNPNSFYLFFEDIARKNQTYNGYGFAHLMMEAMFITIAEYAKADDAKNIQKLEFLGMKGTVGIGSGDTPETSIPLYLSFDGFEFDDYKIHVKKELLNMTQRNIIYEMVAKETD